MTNYIGGKSLDLSALPPSGEVHHILIDENGVLTTALPSTGGGGSYTEVANKAALGSAAVAGQWKKNLISGVVYVSYDNAWKPVGLAVTGTESDQLALETTHVAELELNMQFTVTPGGDELPVTSIWDGTNWITEGP